MIAWLNPVSGLSGDMLLGALLDVGASLPAVTDAVSSTGITGWTLTTAEVQRAGLRALHARVDVTDTASSRPATTLFELAARARPASVARVATEAIRALAEVEARIHGVPVADVHLHELGGVDTIVDVVGVAAAVHDLGITQVWSSALGLGAGTTSSAHGLIPVPAPATLALLRGVPVRGIDIAAETVTPTGAALLKALGCRYGPPPAMTVRVTGYGAGTRDTPGRPNVLQVVLGALSSELSSQPPSTVEPMTVLETTVDDVTGEVLGHLVDVLLRAGAVDAWIAPVTGKKGRPAHVVTALAHPDAAARVEHTLLRETGSLGVRSHEVSRLALARTTAELTVAGHPVRMKVGPYRAKPEYDDVVDVAARTGRALREVAELAVQAWATRGGGADTAAAAGTGRVYTTDVTATDAADPKTWAPRHDDPLFILAMDHRGSFGKSLFNVADDRPTPAQHEHMVAAKSLIFRGLRQAQPELPPGRAGVLVDEQYGQEVIDAALTEAGQPNAVVLAVPIEASGHDWFTLQWPDEWLAHVQRIGPAYAKVLIRDNPDFDDDQRRAQLDLLARCSAALRDAGVPLLYELLVPATDAQLASVDGSPERYDAELRPGLVARVIADNQSAGIEPRLWKVEGLETVEAARLVAAQARAGGRDADLIVLGRDAPTERLNHWLAVAAQVPAFVGFAIGRSIWEDAIRAWVADGDDNAAVARIAQAYLGFTRQWAGSTERQSQ